MTLSNIIQNVPCTLVTGFLGAGKTTVINQLLGARPINDRWALLINEFGHIGIDGMLLTNTQQQNVQNQNTNSNIAIREVNGGCICCTSQLPLQIALTRLLSEQQPQRLIIEPTGLAHPHELLRQLSEPHWQTALKMQAVITVLSALQWQQKKYRSHDGFQAHVRVADVIVVNRYEALNTDQQRKMQSWIHTLNAQASIIWAAANDNESAKTTADQLLTQLDSPSNTLAQQRAQQSRIYLSAPSHLKANVPIALTNDDLPLTDHELPYRYHDQQQAMLLAGWRLPSAWMFSADDVQQWLLQLPHWQRIKGVIHTSDGWLQLNFTPDSLTITTTTAQTDSRLEVILLANDESETSSHRQTTIDWQIYDQELMALIVE